MTSLIVNHLGINPGETAKYVQAWTLSRSVQIFAYTRVTARTRNSTRFISHGLLGSLSSLTGFTTNLFTSIANAFAMIRLRRTDSANLSSHLSNFFAVKSIDFDLTRLL